MDFIRDSNLDELKDNQTILEAFIIMLESQNRNRLNYSHKHNNCKAIINYLLKQLFCEVLHQLLEQI